MNPKPGWEWRNTAVLSGTILFTLTGLFSWNRLTPIWLRDMGATDAQIGWTMLFLSFAHRIPQILGGYLADRIGRKQIVAVGTLLMAICYAGIGLAPSWQWAMVANGLCWIIGAIQWPALLLLVAESVPEHKRGRAVAILEMASWIGVTSGFLLGWAVLNRIPLMQGGWKWLCLLTAFCYFGCAIARGLGLVETSHQRSTGSPWRRLASISWKPLVLPTAAFVAVSVALNVAVDGPLKELYLRDVNKYPEPELDFLNFCGGLIAIPLALGTGWLADRVGSIRLIFTAALLLAGGSLFMLLQRAPSAAPFVFVLFVIPAEIFTVSWHKLITTIAPADNRALCVSTTGLIAGLAVPWSNPGMMALYPHGPAWPFAISLVTGVIGAVLAGALAFRKTKAPEPLPAPAPESPS